MAAAAALVEDLAEARRRVQQCKAAVRREKRALHEAAEHLAHLEAECRRLGIAFTVHSVGVERTSHGHTDTGS